MRRVPERAETEVLTRPNVVGVMVGYKIVGGQETEELCIVALVTHKLPTSKLRPSAVIPRDIDGIRTDVVAVGRLRALAVLSDRRARLRPCPMGTSGGHPSVTAGTNGELLRDRTNGTICIGTNNHVAAASNDAAFGDPYLQPGPFDGGTAPGDVIGELARYVPIKMTGGPSTCGTARLVSDVFNLAAALCGRATRLRSVLAEAGPNLVDAALVLISREDDVLPTILDIGIPSGTREAELRLPVQKSGRTTGHTLNGTVGGVDATVKVEYGTGKTAVFRRQIVIKGDGFSAGGDSGSLVLDLDRYAVGKLFAGGEGVTLANPIDEYLDALDAELITGD